MALTINDAVAVSFRGSLFGQRILSVLYYRPTSTLTAFSVPADQVDIMDKIRGGTGADFWQSDWLAGMPPEYTLDEIRVQTIHPVRYAPAIFPVGLPGTSLFSARVPNQAITVTKRTELAGRRYVGSLHIPAGDNLFTDGLVNSDGINVTNNIRDKIPTEIEVTTGKYIEPILFHRGFVPFHTKILTATQEETARVMRRRTVRVGE